MSKTKEMDDVIKVINFTPKGRKATRKYSQGIKYFKRLGREVKISPKACATINDAGFGIQLFTDSVSVSIGIGKDHSADLIMDKEAWEALKNGEKISITTTEQFKKYINEG